MPHEAVGELLVGLIEVGVEAGTSGNNKNNRGCFIAIICIIIAGIIIYYNVK